MRGAGHAQPEKLGTPEPQQKGSKRLPEPGGQARSALHIADDGGKASQAGLKSLPIAWRYCRCEWRPRMSERPLEAEEIASPPVSPAPTPEIGVSRCERHPCEGEYSRPVRIGQVQNPASATVESRNLLSRSHRAPYGAESTGTLDGDQGHTMRWLRIETPAGLGDVHRDFRMQRRCLRSDQWDRK